MEMNLIRDEVKTKLTGGILDLEINDETLDKVINSAFREVQRYINTTAIMKMEYQPCLDLSTLKVSAVVDVYRTKGYFAGDPTSDDSFVDPTYVAQWQLLTGMAGSGFDINNFATNFGAWNAALQVRNTISTDLNFIFDKPTSKLYINCAFNKPKYIAIRYIPRFDSVEEITSDYWIDIIIRLAVALTKVTLGNIRGRFTQSNALWTQDAEKMANEGNEELKELRQYLQDNNILIFPMD